MTDDRRKKGQGGLRSLSDGRYRIEVRNQDGRLSRIFEAANDTEAEVRGAEIAVALRAELKARKDARYTQRTERAERQAWTVRQYTAYYLEWAEKRLANTTMTRKRGVFENNVLPYIGDLKIAEVTTDDLLDMYAALGAKGARHRGGDGGLSGNTIWTVHNHVRGLFTFACDIRKDFAENPAAGKGALPNVDRTPNAAKALSVARVEEVLALMRAEALQDLAVPVALSAYLGTRRGETVGLRFSDIDYDERRITVRRSVSRTIEHGVKVKPTKTNKSREIPLDDDVLAWLKTVQAETRRARMGHGKAWRGAEKPADDYIAHEVTGAQIRPDIFGNRFRTFCEQQGIAGVTLHGFRHAFVSQLIALGFDAVTIATITGHSPDVLLRTYAHAFDDRARLAMETLADERRKAREQMA